MSDEPTSEDEIVAAPVSNTEQPSADEPVADRHESAAHVDSGAVTHGAMLFSMVFQWFLQGGVVWLLAKQCNVTPGYSGTPEYWAVPGFFFVVYLFSCFNDSRQLQSFAHVKPRSGATERRESGETLQFEAGRGISHFLAMSGYPGAPGMKGTEGVDGAVVQGVARYAPDITGHHLAEHQPPTGQRRLLVEYYGRFSENHFRSRGRVRPEGYALYVESALDDSPGVVVKFSDEATLLHYEIHACSVGYDPWWVTDLLRRCIGLGSAPLKIYEGDHVIIRGYFRQGSPSGGLYRDPLPERPGWRTLVLARPPHHFNTDSYADVTLDTGVIARGTLGQLRRRRWKYFLTDPYRLLLGNIIITYVLVADVFWLF